MLFLYRKSLVAVAEDEYFSSDEMPICTWHEYQVAGATQGRNLYFSYNGVRFADASGFAKAAHILGPYMLDVVCEAIRRDFHGPDYPGEQNGWAARTIGMFPKEA